MKKVDITGLRFGRVQVVADSPHRLNGRRFVSCQCDCGVLFDCDPRSLSKGHTKSCGCLHRERVAASTGDRSRVHGGTGTREYNIWQKMKSRCLHANDKKYKDYGERGIKVCNKWLSFEAFLADMGLSPSPSHSIERVDVNGNYEPGNCRWATPLEQGRNKRNHRLVELGGRQLPLSQACEETGINYRSALYRLNRGLAWQPLPLPPTGTEQDKSC